MDNWAHRKKGETKLDKFVIHGGHRLTGEIEVSGAKNAAVALIPAVLLCDEPCILENVPDISDVSISLRIMSEMGCAGGVSVKDHSPHFCNGTDQLLRTL